MNPGISRRLAIAARLYLPEFCVLNCIYKGCSCKIRLSSPAAEYGSRLLVGTGKYRDFAQTAEALDASGAEIVTVAIRRVNLGQNPDQAQPARRPAQGPLHPAAQHRRLLHRRRRRAHPAPGARAVGRPSPGQAGVLGDPTSLFPHVTETLKAAERW